MSDWIDNLARLAEAATPGPWEATQEGLTHPDGWEIDAPDGPVVSECCGYRGSVGKTADAEFIAAANPTTILRLIEDNRRMRHGSLCPECNAKAWGERADFRRERDELAAKVAAVEALADETEQAGDPLLRLDRLRAALSAAPTDTTQGDTMTVLNPGSIGNPDEQPIVQLPPELAAFFGRTRCPECDRINNTHTDDCSRADK